MGTHMKKLLALSILIAAGTLHASEAALTTAERAHAIQLLQDSQKEFLTLVDGLSDAQWTYKPAPDRWSVGETAEHIVLADAGLFGSLQKALDSPPNPEWETKTRGKTEFLEKVMVDRSHKAKAPEAIVPQSKISHEEVIQRYKEGRAREIKFAEETEVALKEHTADHPFPVFGTLERIPMADLHPAPQYASQPTDRRSKSQPWIPQ